MKSQSSNSENNQLTTALPMSGFVQPMEVEEKDLQFVREYFYLGKSRSCGYNDKYNKIEE
jgi:CRISPR/Cas system-associated protein endoribonuclease Cas2